MSGSQVPPPEATPYNKFTQSRVPDERQPRLGFPGCLVASRQEEETRDVSSK